MQAVMEQRTRALEIANRIRSARKVLKQELKSGVTDGADLLEELPELIENVPVGDFLEWLPGVGRWRVKRLVESLRTSHSQTLVGLGERRRRELAAMLRGDL